MDRSLTGDGYTDTVETELIAGTRMLPGAQRRQGTVETEVIDGGRLLSGVRDRRGTVETTVEAPPATHRPEQVIPRPSATAADDHPSEYQEEPRRRARGPVTTPQIIGAIVLTAACLAGVLWYVPQVVTADSRSFTGTVTSNGITDLNFASSGRIGTVLVHVGQDVKSGTVLATESSSSTQAQLSADRAAITADLATLQEFQDGPQVADTHARIEEVDATLAKDKAQLASDRVKLVETEIIAPSSGTVLAINGAIGETVTSIGLRSYATSSPASSAQQPAFSLLPLGPKSSVVGGSTPAVLPMISLRASGGWLVKVLVPQSAVASIRTGEHAQVSVPAIRLRNVPGVVLDLAPTPVTTPEGVAYEVAINITGHRRIVPLTGMTADIRLH